MGNSWSLLADGDVGEVDFEDPKIIDDIISFIKTDEEEFVQHLNLDEHKTRSIRRDHNIDWWSTP